MNSLLFRKQWIGLSLIAVELEVGLSCRLADDEHHDSLLLVGNRAVRKFDLLDLFIMMTAFHADHVHQIRPRLQQSTQFRIVLTDPQRMTDIHRCDTEDDNQ